MAPASSPSVSAVLMAYNSARTIGEVLDRLAELPVGEVIVADNGSTDDTAAVVKEHAAAWDPPRRVELLAFPENIGVAARNRAVERAGGDFLLFVDDDSYPLPGTIERLVAAFEAAPRTAVVAGLVVEVDADKRVRNRDEPGTFDWMLRAGHRGPAPVEGLPAYFFPEGASMARRSAFTEVGGYYEKLFFTQEGFELTARLLAAGWDVRYVPDAPFHHMKEPRAGADHAGLLRLAVRNQLWYFWLRFPPALAARRAVAYAAYDLLQALYRRAPGAWAGGVADAWRQRGVVRADRAPLTRETARRAELRRGRMHLRLVAAMARRWLTRR